MTTLTGYILFVSPTYSGSVHDKKVADELEFSFQKTVVLLQDTGFQGYQPKNALIVQPTKKTKKKPLSEEEKEVNKQISAMRVVVEQAIRGLKIWRIAKDVCRYYQSERRHQFIIITAALHNFRKKCNAQN